MLQAGRHSHRNMAVKAFVLVLTIWMASLAYCLAHESAHAAAAVVSGGEVYGIGISVIGDTGRTTYSAIQDNGVMAIIYAAGLAATTMLALAALWLDLMPVTVLIAIRTILAALNYAPGTDMARVHALAGDVSIFLTLGLVVINLIVAIICIKKPLQEIRETFSSLWRARPAHNSPE